MKDIILSELKKIEDEQNVKILLAVESGSRAWGFESPDSDYDVRFIYVRPQTEYLKLNANRDVIELPINDVLDINGWDLDKTLKLLHNSNPTVFEWFSSPIVYAENEAFCRQFRPLLMEFFSSKRGLYHYLSMAKSNYREFLIRDEEVKLKKYFYVLRPLLACKWILDRACPPPMLFSELMEAELDESIRPEVDRLLNIKKNAPEIKLIPRVQILNDYVETLAEEVSAKIMALPDETSRGWDDLNGLFRATIENYQEL